MTARFSCRQVKAVIAYLSAEGYQVKRIDVSVEQSEIWVLSHSCYLHEMRFISLEALWWNLRDIAALLVYYHQLAEYVRRRFKRSCAKERSRILEWCRGEMIGGEGRWENPITWIGRRSLYRDPECLPPYWPLLMKEARSKNISSRKELNLYLLENLQQIEIELGRQDLSRRLQPASVSTIRQRI